MLEKLVTDALIMWATIDPIGTLAIFVALTSRLSSEERKRIALKTTLYSAAVLLGALVAGQLVLAGMGIQLISLQIAGGVILFVFGLQMVFGHATDITKAESGHDVAVFPLAIPATASPGAIMAVIVLSDNSLYSVATQAITAGVVLAVLGVTYVLMIFADPVIKFIGKAGASILTRVMGMILAALSVELVMRAFGLDRWIGQAL